jgi:hypothetical protein
VPIRQKILALAVSLTLLVIIVELVRRRRLREEYSFLWIATGLGILVLALWYGLLERITRFIGAGLPTSTLFFFALVFLMLLSLQFSVKVSDLSKQVKNLAQQIALLQVKEPGNDRRAGRDREETPGPQ